MFEARVFPSLLFVTFITWYLLFPYYFDNMLSFFDCQVPVQLEWSKEGGDLPRGRAIDDRQGLLVITDVRVSDSGTYICSARDGHSIVTERVTLTVGGMCASSMFHFTLNEKTLNSQNKGKERENSYQKLKRSP